MTERDLSILRRGHGRPEPDRRTARATPPRTTPTGDQETRARLLDASARLFAERGLARVTVRDICRQAGTNVAAVNYHFGGKQGLYTAVMQAAIAMMQKTSEAAQAAGEGQAPERRLHSYVSAFLQRVAGKGHDTWIHQLMMRELADPTPALDMVAEQVLKPRMAYLCGTLGELVSRPADDPCVVLCALSIQAQFQGLLWHRIMPTVPGAENAPETLAAIAEHITDFSLRGVMGFQKSG